MFMVISGWKRDEWDLLSPTRYVAEDRQVWSLDRGSTAHQCYEEKQRAIYIQQVLLHASSFHLCVRVRRDEARTAAAAVIVNWIKLKKDLFKRAKK